jgi:sortase A
VTVWMPPEWVGGDPSSEPVDPAAHVPAPRAPQPSEEAPARPAKQPYSWFAPHADTHSENSSPSVHEPAPTGQDGPRRPDATPAPGDGDAGSGASQVDGPTEIARASAPEAQSPPSFDLAPPPADLAPPPAGLAPSSFDLAPASFDPPPAAALPPAADTLPPAADTPLLAGGIAPLPKRVPRTPPPPFGVAISPGGQSLFQPPKRKPRSELREMPSSGAAPRWAPHPPVVSDEDRAATWEQPPALVDEPADPPRWEEPPADAPVRSPFEAFRRGSTTARPSGGDDEPDAAPGPPPFGSAPGSLFGSPGPARSGGRGPDVPDPAGPIPVPPGRGPSGPDLGGQDGGRSGPDGPRWADPADGPDSGAGSTGRPVPGGAWLPPTGPSRVGAAGSATHDEPPVPRATAAWVRPPVEERTETSWSTPGRPGSRLPGDFPARPPAPQGFHGTPVDPATGERPGSGMSGEDRPTGAGADERSGTAWSRDVGSGAARPGDRSAGDGVEERSGSAWSRDVGPGGGPAGDGIDVRSGPGWSWGAPRADSGPAGAPDGGGEQSGRAQDVRSGGERSGARAGDSLFGGDPAADGLGERSGAGRSRGSGAAGDGDEGRSGGTRAADDVDERPGWPHDDHRPAAGMPERTGGRSREVRPADDNADRSGPGRPRDDHRAADDSDDRSGPGRSRDDQRADERSGPGWSRDDHRVGDGTGERSGRDGGGPRGERPRQPPADWSIGGRVFGGAAAGGAFRGIPGRDADDAPRNDPPRGLSGNRSGAGTYQEDPTEVIGPFDIGSWTLQKGTDAPADRRRPRPEPARLRTGTTQPPRDQDTSARSRADDAPAAAGGGGGGGTRPPKDAEDGEDGERDRSTRGDRVRTVIRGVGQTLLTFGVVLLLLAAYEVWFTDLVNDRTQARLKTQLEQQWETGDDPVVAAQEPATPGQKVRSIPLGDGFALIYIPDFGTDYVYTVVEGTGVDELNEGPGHYPDTPLPGAVGNVAIAGHRVGKGSPFLNLDKLKANSAIVIRTRSYWYTYRVLGDARTGNPKAVGSLGVPGMEIVDPANVGVLDPVPNKPGVKAARRLLTLTTCHPKFSARERLVIHAQQEGAPRPTSAGLPPALAGD